MTLFLLALAKVQSKSIQQILFKITESCTQFMCMEDSQFNKSFASIKGSFTKEAMKEG